MPKKTIIMSAIPKKNSTKYEASGDDLPFDNIYIKNSFFDGDAPDKIAVTVDTDVKKSKNKEE
jgi:hypothetical protein